MSRARVSAILVSMPFVMCSCPGDNCVEENEPSGYVVKMKNDYTDKVIVRMFISSVTKDTTYCCETLQGHTINICGDYYLLHCSYDIVAYTEICSKDWNETMMDSISNYILDTNPFSEVYACYRKYEQNELKEIIESNSLGKLNRLK
ncbi:MAG: hypothetical protein MJZ19_10815 [Paludibacteraceae bacterium]|nr:hypothetical protein [Paludibacteraceae bacterium]